MMAVASLYDRRIRELAQAAHGAGRLCAPDGSAARDSPICGDRVHMEVCIEQGRIAALAHEVRGCILCRAAASLLGQKAIGLPASQAGTLLDELKGLLTSATPCETWPELEAFAPVAPHRSRHGCVLLPFEALLAAMRAAERSPSPQ